MSGITVWYRLAADGWEDASRVFKVCVSEKACTRFFTPYYLLKTATPLGASSETLSSVDSERGIF